MKKYHDHLDPHCFYHLYNHAIGSENLFHENKNYTFFIGKWEEYITSYANIWAYCLMPNHFHFVIQIRDKNCFPASTGANKFLEGQFKRLFSSYTLSFNKVYDRRGSLFQKSFKRAKVDSEQYLQHLIHYIHHNPIHHHFTDGYADWKYSSYTSILSKQPTKVKRQDVLQLFGGKDAFIKYHNQMKNYNVIDHLIME